MSLFKNKNSKRDTVIKLETTIPSQDTTPTDTSKLWVDTSIQ